MMRTNDPYEFFSYMSRITENQKIMKDYSKSLGMGEGGIDVGFLFILEAVIAMSHFASLKYYRNNNLDSAKHCIVWKTLREIAD